MRDLFTLQMALTLFVALLILAPIPPSTIIGMAVVSHPKTNRHLDPRVIGPILRLTAYIKGLFKRG